MHLRAATFSIPELHGAEMQHGSEWSLLPVSGDEVNLTNLVHISAFYEH